jgi:prepilin-type N-terminal cleavage/methylation domain-containing protein
MRLPLNLKRFHHDKRGFTIIEILIALAISGFLAAGIGVAISQIGRVSDVCNSRVVAINQVENAIHYINRDIQQAQKIEINGSGYWIRLTWVSWVDDSTIQVVYNVDSSRNLMRQEATTIGGSTNVTTITVARYIDSGSKAVTAPDTALTPPEKSWTVQLSAIYSSGIKTASETREIKIVPRPGI